MIYKKYNPPTHLKKYIECFFVWELDPRGTMRVESPPNGYGSIVFNYERPYKVKNPIFKDNKKVPKVFVAGQATCSYDLTIENKIGMVGIVFQPAGLNTLFNIPMGEMTNERIDLGVFFTQSRVDELQEKIYVAKSIDQRIKVLIDLVNFQLMRNEKRFDVIDQTASQIVNVKGIVNINQMMGEVYMSRRNFERKFFQKVGLSPKYYARIRRIGYLCSLMAGERKVEDWQSLFFKCGYYDQAHFIKDFNFFLGRTPSAYLESNVELAHYLKA